MVYSSKFLEIWLCIDKVFFNETSSSTSALHYVIIIIRDLKSIAEIIAIK